MGRVSRVFRNAFVLFPVGTQSLITSPDFVEPFTEFRDFAQFLNRNLLRQSHFHTGRKLML